jgi:hypothetical protein
LLSTPSQTSADGAPGAQVSTSAPPVQTSSPVAAQAPVPQLVGVGAMPSSTEPSQLLSTPSHTSADGAPGAQVSTSAPPVQTSSPVAAQAPVPQLVGVGAMPSSTEPSQLLSTPSQTSADGAPGAQVSTRAPPVQTSSPVAAQAPVPQLVGVGAMPSSTEPSQLLSTPSQTSADGAPGAQVSTSAPPVQTSSPVAAQAPVPQLVGTGAMPSSTEPLQSLSRPSQSSGVPSGGVHSVTMPPPTQATVPTVAHSPTPQDGGSGKLGSLSTVPSQSLSRPSQSSGVPAGGVQLPTSSPSTQAMVPVVTHSPRPHVGGAGSTGPSSVAPLQLSSSALQTSNCAGAPGTHVSPTTPATQVVSPCRAHTPTPHEVTAGTKPSSVAPSQSSSTPLQPSTGAGTPGVQVSVTLPVAQVVVPVAAHAPTPQEVGVGTKTPFSPGTQVSETMPLVQIKKPTA